MNKLSELEAIIEDFQKAIVELDESIPASVDRRELCFRLREFGNALVRTNTPQRQDDESPLVNQA